MRQTSIGATCPNPCCGIVLKVPQTDSAVRDTCYACETQLCLCCHQPWSSASTGISHYGFRCREYATLLEGTDGAEAERERFLSSLPPELQSTIGKPCPICGLVTLHAKYHSCHHVNGSKGCPGCGYGYCTVCLGPWPCANDCGLMCSSTCDCPPCPFCKPGKPCWACNGPPCPSCLGETPDQRAAREKREAEERAVKVSAGWCGPRDRVPKEEVEALRAANIPKGVTGYQVLNVLGEQVGELEEALFAAVDREASLGQCFEPEEAALRKRHLEGSAFRPLPADSDSKEYETETGAPVERAPAGRPTASGAATGWSFGGTAAEAAPHPALDIEALLICFCTIQDGLAMACRMVDGTSAEHRNRLGAVTLEEMAEGANSAVKECTRLLYYLRSRYQRGLRTESGHGAAGSAGPVAPSSAAGAGMPVAGVATAAARAPATTARGALLARLRSISSTGHSSGASHEGTGSALASAGSSVLPGAVQALRDQALESVGMALQMVSKSGLFSPDGDAERGFANARYTYTLQTVLPALQVACLDAGLLEGSGAAGSSSAPPSTPVALSPAHVALLLHGCGEVCRMSVRDPRQWAATAMALQPRRGEAPSDSGLRATGRIAAGGVPVMHFEVPEPRFAVLVGVLRALPLLAAQRRWEALEAAAGAISAFVWYKQPDWNNEPLRQLLDEAGALKAVSKALRVVHEERTRVLSPDLPAVVSAAALVEAGAAQSEPLSTLSALAAAEHALAGLLFGLAHAFPLRSLRQLRELAAPPATPSTTAEAAPSSTTADGPGKVPPRKAMGGRARRLMRCLSAAEEVEAEGASAVPEPSAADAATAAALPPQIPAILRAYESLAWLAPRPWDRPAMHNWQAPYEAWRGAAWAMEYGAWQERVAFPAYWATLAMSLQRLQDLTDACTIQLGLSLPVVPAVVAPPRGGSGLRREASVDPMAISHAVFALPANVEASAAVDVTGSGAKKLSLAPPPALLDDTVAQLWLTSGQLWAFVSDFMEGEDTTDQSWDLWDAVYALGGAHTCLRLLRMPLWDHCSLAMAAPCRQALQCIGRLAAGVCTAINPNAAVLSGFCFPNIDPHEQRAVVARVAYHRQVPTLFEETGYATAAEVAAAAAGTPMPAAAEASVRTGWGLTARSYRDDGPVVPCDEHLFDGERIGQVSAALVAQLCSLCLQLGLRTIPALQPATDGDGSAAAGIGLHGAAAVPLPAAAREAAATVKAILQLLETSTHRRTVGCRIEGQVDVVVATVLQREPDFLTVLAQLLMVWTSGGPAAAPALEWIASFTSVVLSCRQRVLLRGCLGRLLHAPYPALPGSTATALPAVWRPAAEMPWAESCREGIMRSAVASSPFLQSLLQLTFAPAIPTAQSFIHSLLALLATASPEAREALQECPRLCRHLIRFIEMRTLQNPVAANSAAAALAKIMQGHPAVPASCMAATAAGAEGAAASAGPVAVDATGGPSHCSPFLAAAISSGDGGGTVGLLLEALAFLEAGGERREGIIEAIAALSVHPRFVAALLRDRSEVAIPPPTAAEALAAPSPEAGEASTAACTRPSSGVAGSGTAIDAPTPTAVPASEVSAAASMLHHLLRQMPSRIAWPNEALNIARSIIRVVSSAVLTQPAAIAAIAAAVPRAPAPHDAGTAPPARVKGVSRLHASSEVAFPLLEALLGLPVLAHTTWAFTAVETGFPFGPVAVMLREWFQLMSTLLPADIPPVVQSSEHVRVEWQDATVCAVPCMLPLLARASASGKLLGFMECMPSRMARVRTDAQLCRSLLLFSRTLLFPAASPSALPADALARAAASHAATDTKEASETTMGNRSKAPTGRKHADVEDVSDSDDIAADAGDGRKRKPRTGGRSGASACLKQKAARGLTSARAAPGSLPHTVDVSAPSPSAAMRGCVGFDVYQHLLLPLVDNGGGYATALDLLVAQDSATSTSDPHSCSNAFALACLSACLVLIGALPETSTRVGSRGGARSEGVGAAAIDVDDTTARKFDKIVAKQAARVIVRLLGGGEGRRSADTAEAAGSVLALLLRRDVLGQTVWFPPGKAPKPAAAPKATPAQALRLAQFVLRLRDWGGSASEAVLQQAAQLQDMLRGSVLPHAAHLQRHMSPAEVAAVTRLLQPVLR
jgi:hypothetical protein